jgi:PTH1 family peptidyl-tRNA hydrolase
VSEPWLIVGLGNPGAEYARTRHNVGFRVADELARRHGLGFRRTRYRAQEASGSVVRVPVRLLKPQTYMNESGFAVNRAAQFHRIPLGRILVVHDDIDLPLGRLRFREGGSSGGNNGVKSVISHLRSQAFHRLKIGVGRPPPFGARDGGPDDAIDHVLSGLRTDEAAVIEPALERAADAVELLLAEGPTAAMNRFNA